MLQRFLNITVSLLFVLAFSAAAYAQVASGAQTGDGAGKPASSLSVSASSVATPVKSDISDRLANWNGTLLVTEQALSRAGLEDSELAQKTVEITAIRLNALELEKQIAPLVGQIREQLDELGPAPKSDEPAETEQIAKKRIELEERYSQGDGEIKAARLIALRADQIEQQIIKIRRARFVTQISKRTFSIFGPNLWSAFWQGLDGFDYRFNLLVSDSISAMRTKFENLNLQIFLIQIFLILGAAGILAYFVVLARRLLRRLLVKTISADVSPDQISRDDDSGDPDRQLNHFTRIQLAAISFLSNGLVPVAGIVSLYFLIATTDLVTARLESLLRGYTLIAAGTICALALARSYLAAGDATRRIVNLPQQQAVKINRIILIAVILVTAIALINETAKILVSPLELSIGLSALLALTCTISLILVLTTIASNGIATENADAEITIQPNLVRWGYLNPLFWMLCLGGLISLVTGYIAFAEFLTWQILIGAFVFGLLWLILELLDYHRDRYLDAKSDRWRVISRATGLSRQAVLQGMVFGFGLVKLATILAAVTVFLISWGYRTGDWSRPISEAFFGFKIGSLSISFSAIALAMIIFIVGYIFTRTIQHWLRNQFLPTTTLDPGLRNSIATIFGYGGIVITILLAITTAGLDLSKVAIIAGALSVGIGFGLQSIVSNFVSGLILLTERPIKSGDWIVTSGGEGTVKKTSVRSTEIETFDGATVVIPNSTLISDAVTNWTHHSHRGRIKIAIGVGYDSDPDQVRDILLECAKSHYRVLKRPGPSVFFMDFGADALIFEMRAYLADINNSISTKSDLRFAILKALRQANIEIPYPQRDLHIKSMPAKLTDTVKPRAKPASSLTKAKSAARAKSRSSNKTAKG